jgi:hypothetical protein
MEHLPGTYLSSYQAALAQPWRLFSFLVLFIFMGSRLILSDKALKKQKRIKSTLGPKVSPPAHIIF